MKADISTLHKPDILTLQRHRCYICCVEGRRSVRCVKQKARSEIPGKPPSGALMCKKITFLLLAFAVSAASLVAQTRTVRTTLDIYVVDVEGGNSVLFVAPSGESVLIDTGTWPQAPFVMPNASWPL